ncbi:MAG TPA: HDIG domain-containing protein [Candidatus Krumholzibacteria bacterium]|nr:HDIG domain-containing protein [Candidatus Krumholzibacteria bacterium]
MWWLRVRDLLARDRSAKETRPGAVPGAAKAAAAEGRRAPSPWWAVGSGLFLLALHLVLFPPVPRLTSDFPKLGEIAEREIRAPFSFDAPLLETDVQMRRLERVVVEPPVLRAIDDAGGPDGGARMEVWLHALASALADHRSTPADRAGLLALQFPGIDQDDLLRLLRSDEPDSLAPRLTRSWRQVLRGGVADILPPGRYDRVVVAGSRAETLRDRARITAQADLEERLTAELRATGLPPVEAVEAASVMRHFVTPNLVYDPDESDLRRTAARETVPTRREFIAGERIIDQGVRVTEQQALFLEQLESLVLSRGGGEGAGARVVRGVGRALLVALALALFGWLGRIHIPRRQRRPRPLVAQTVILGVFLVGAAVALGRPGLGPMAVPVVLLSLLSTVLLKSRSGYMSTLLAMAMLAVLPGVQALNTFSWFIVGMATVVSVRRIQKRSQFYQTIVLLTVLSLLMVFLEGLVGAPEQRPGGGTYLVAVFAPVLSVAFGLFLLPVVEPLVGVCSDLTLLELSDLNHPLLQRMALESQGTYHHSQVVGQLAEHAARAIDANALLVRVGALFHDIGKMQKPEYYVENQRPDYNKHDELSPSMSALVIAAHVKEGIELGRKWRLPQQVIDFIPEHHGTMVMEYFYHKALEAEGNETVKVDDFRYPGPKPQTRETAVLMLADATEAATRSLAKPTPGRIREVTKQVIDKRMLSGELDESGLTLSELARIREAFIPLLVGIHHARIQYPGQRGREGDRAAERRPERKTRT